MKSINFSDISVSVVLVSIFRKDKFFIETKYLGKLNAINIRHDNSWFGSGWYLDKVKLLTGMCTI